MPKGRPLQPRAQAPLPVRFAVIDDKGRFRALVENFSGALRVFAQLNLDKPPRDPDELALLMCSACWRIEEITKPWVPVTRGHDLLWSNDGYPDDREGPPGEEDGFVIWLRP